MPSGERRGRASAMEKKRLMDTDLVPRIEISEFICYLIRLSSKSRTQRVLF